MLGSAQILALAPAQSALCVERSSAATITRRADSSGAWSAAIARRTGILDGLAATEG